MPDAARAVGAITMFVADPVRSKAYYQKTFDLPVLFEDETSVAFQLDNLILNLVARSSADELIEPAAVAGADAGASAMLTMWVDDADAACADLSARGVDLLNGPTTRPWGVRTAAFADPDGHVWEVAQQLPG